MSTRARPWTVLALTLTGLATLACGGLELEPWPRAPIAEPEPPVETPPPLDDAGVVQAIRAAAGLDSQWKDEVRSVLTRTYDRNGSGDLDTPLELDGMSCEVWLAIDAGVTARWGAGVRPIFGLAPDFHWGGEVLGLSEGIRPQIDAAATRCGLTLH